jgi:hypothetical protein
MDEINVKIWYSKRQLEKVPVHFIKATTPITAQSLAWIRNFLYGRFAVHRSVDDSFGVQLSFENKEYPFFEESSEVMMYELRWSGSK